MAIAYDALTSREQALKGLLETALVTLARGLPDDQEPGVYLGPAREALDSKHFCVFVARNGLPLLEYDMGQTTGQWTVEFDLALQSYWPQSAEQLELYCGYFAANVLSVLHDNCKRSGTDGWNKGIVQSTEAIRFRREGHEGAYEIEVIPFRVTFEVSY